MRQRLNRSLGEASGEIVFADDEASGQLAFENFNLAPSTRRRIRQGVLNKFDLVRSDYDELV